jgi:hypothetical protein
VKNTENFPRHNESILFIPLESALQDLSNEWSCLEILGVLKFWGKFCVHPLVTEVTIALNPLRMEGNLRKLQKVMKLCQNWKDFENNGTT